MAEQKTLQAAVIGWPIEHSKSPIIHGHWLDTYGIDGTYEKIAVEPDHLAQRFQEFVDAGYRGWNVTLPYKEDTYALMDHLDETAQRMKAVNTVVVSSNGALTGYNTDGYGFITNLTETCPEWCSQETVALVLGAGGAARAAVDALAQKGVPKIYLMNRTRAKAEAFIEDFATETTQIVVADWDDKTFPFSDVTLLVNTTSLGMTGQPALPLDIVSGLRSSAIVYDLVYVPLYTDLLTQAKARGLQCVTGIGMLLHQAVPGFQHWFGQKPDVTDALVQKLI